jgi:hypothetical protein
LDLSGKYNYEGKKSTRFGNRPIEAKTKYNYENCCKQLWRFCVIKGDYESLLALLSPRPENTPSINVETLDDFFALQATEGWHCFAHIRQWCVVPFARMPLGN